jgi:hypothetical protein
MRRGLVDFSEPNWIIVTVIGAVLGALAASYGSAVLWPVRRLRRHPLEGTWHEWHYTFADGREQLRRGELTIRRGALKPFVIKARGSMPDLAGTSATKLRYTGDLTVESHSILLSLHSADDPTETLVFRFKARVTFATQVMAGIWMCFDFDLHTAAGASIISRHELTEEEATRLIGSVTHRAKYALRIR